MKSACGVADNNVRISCLCGCDCIKHNGSGVAALIVLYDIRTCTIHPYLELVDSSGSECIGGGNYYLFALICELCRQLSYGGGLARTVYADNKHYRRLCGKVKLLVLAQHFGDDGFQLVFYEHRVGDALFLDLFSQLGPDIHRSLHADIAHYKSFFKLFKKIFIYLGKRIYKGIDLAHHRVSGLFDALGNFIEKSHI